MGKDGKVVISYKNNGKARVAIDKIEKGILADGLNFQEKENIISVGGDKQPTEDGVKSFALKLSELVEKEISGIRMVLTVQKNLPTC
ncbi:MAG: hypothetical protein EOP49_04375 [Sphingobacteriales bacterium]|nr:MAG: hypothetical protein EOP49_04375 [Sphingobacteriales bacterium]